MSTFNEFINSKPQSEPKLPLCHTCDGFRFRGIIGDQKLIPSPCKVFGDETLIYCFYGKPSYRTSASANPTLINAFMPICFVLKNNAINNPKRIAPFDTGAFNQGLFAQHLHPKMKKEDFLLSPSMDTPQRIVNFFFGSNLKYFKGEPLNVDIPSIEFEALSYYSIIKETGNLPFDDRCSTIEIQSSEPVELTKDNVLLIILPGIFMEDERVKNFFNTLSNVKIRVYTIHRGDPREYMGLIYQSVEEFLHSNGFM